MRMTSTPLSRRRFIAGSVSTAALTWTGGIAKPYPSRATDRPIITHGLQSGDIGVDSGVVWARSDRPAKLGCSHRPTNRITAPPKGWSDGSDASGRPCDCLRRSAVGAENQSLHNGNEVRRGRGGADQCAVSGAASVRPVVTLTLSVDHRVADGATAARFLSDVAERLEQGAL